MCLNVYMKVSGKEWKGVCERLARRKRKKLRELHTDSETERERMWKITLYLSMFLWACPVEDCHHIAQD